MNSLRIEVPLSELPGWGAGKMVMRDGRRWRVQSLCQDPARQVLVVNLVDAGSMERRLDLPADQPRAGCPLMASW